MGILFLRLGAECLREFNDLLIVPDGQEIPRLLPWLHSFARACAKGGDVGCLANAAGDITKSTLLTHCGVVAFAEQRRTHSPLMFAALMMGHHFSISAF